MSELTNEERWQKIGIEQFSPEWAEHIKKNTRIKTFEELKEILKDAFYMLSSMHGVLKQFEKANEYDPNKHLYPYAIVFIVVDENKNKEGPTVEHSFVVERILVDQEDFIMKMHNLELFPIPELILALENTLSF